MLRKILVSQKEQVNKHGQDCIKIGYTFFLLIHYFQYRSNHMKEVEREGACAIYKREENAHRVLVDKYEV